MVQKSASNNAIEVWQDRGESCSAIYNNSKTKSSGFIKAPRASVAASLVTFLLYIRLLKCPPPHARRQGQSITQLIHRNRTAELHTHPPQPA